MIQLSCTYDVRYIYIYIYISIYLTIAVRNNIIYLREIQSSTSYNNDYNNSV